MDKPQIICHIQKSLSYTLYDAKWIPCSAKFVVMGSHPRGTGAIQIYEIEKTDIKLLKEFEKPKSIKCGTFGASSIQSRNLAFGDFDGNLNILDLETGKAVYRVKAHKEIINTIDGVGGFGIGEGSAEIVTGSRDGAVKIWDQRQNNDPVASMEPAEGESIRDCWAVGFGHAYNPHDRCVVSGYDNGDLKLFDLRAMNVRWQTNLKNGVCSVQFDRKDISMNKLVATTLEGKINVFDMRVQHPKDGFAKVIEKDSSGSTIWAVKHLPSNRDVFMTTGGSGSLNLWQYHYPSKRVENDGDGVPKGVAGTVELLQNITLSGQPIASFDWSPDKTGLAVCTAFDQTLRLLIVTKLNTL